MLSTPTPRKKTGVILHPYLPITGTSRQRLLSSTPQVINACKKFTLLPRWPLWRGLTVVHTRHERLLQIHKLALPPHCFKLVSSVARRAEKRCLTTQITNACEDGLNPQSGVPKSSFVRHHQEPSRTKVLKIQALFETLFPRCWKICISSVTTGTAESRWLGEGA